MSIKTILFDLDGTLIDSVGDIRAALNATFAGRGLRQFDREAVVSMIGSGARTLVALAFDRCEPRERAAGAARALAGESGHEAGAMRGRDDVIDDLLAEFIERYEADATSRTQLFPGARECLEQLAAEGIQLGIVTNKPQGLTDTILENLGLSPLFGSVVGASDNRALKPEPDMLHAALRELESTPDDAVFVGDSPADSGAAAAAGIPFVLITHGYGTPAGDAALAALTIAHFDGLRPALASW